MSQRPILLDTCALLWLVHEDDIETDALETFRTASKSPGGVLTSPISAWEIGQLVAKGRLTLALEPQHWFQAALSVGIELAPMTPEILVASSFLPHSRLRDPADKILAATARAFDYRLMTRDRPLLDYASAGHARAIPC